VLPEFVDRSARRHPSRVALRFEGTTRTYAELEARVDLLAGAIVARGVRPGDRVGLLLQNGLEFVETLLAYHRAGAAAVPINFRLVADEVDYVLRDSSAIGLVAGAELAHLAAKSPGFRIVVGNDYERALDGADPLRERVDIGEDDPALVVYTSGTTGRPKGAVLSHRSLVASTLSWIHEMHAGADDVWLSGQPLFHIGGINGLLPFLFVGAMQVISPTSAFEAAAAVRRLDENGATMCIFVPTQWDEVCRAAAAEGVDCGRLRVAMWGASSCPRATLELMARTFPSAEIVSAYGQTETAGATTLLKGPDSTRKLGSVGKPMLGVELRIVDDDLRDVGVGDVGEIVYRGPMLTSGYLGNPAATDEAFAGGWFHSGDLARVDAEGYITIVDRKKDLIVSGGENVYPAEVERVLLEHPAVSDVAVVGAPHPRWVETPHAFVVVAEGAAPAEAELIDHCRARLAGYKKPTRIVFVDALPRNAAGKVLKRELRILDGLR
jgi:acyl-CoA synthetase (AMP-forming)/AMP-acid ligase II